jgi:hypothetical protein
MADVTTDIGSLMAELNGQTGDKAEESMKPENREESSQIKEIVRDENGHMMIHFISLQEALKLQQRMELIAHEDENFEGDGVYGFETGQHKDAAMAHRFSFYQRTNGKVLKYEYK